jgi:hypothetical protein
MPAYRQVHVGPNTQPGGCHDGLRRLRYQCESVFVPNDPATAVAALASPPPTKLFALMAIDCPGSRPDNHRQPG